MLLAHSIRLIAQIVLKNLQTFKNYFIITPHIEVFNLALPSHSNQITSSLL